MNPPAYPADRPIIDELLRNSTAEEADALRPVLLGLQNLGAGAPLTPSPEIEALLRAEPSTPISKGRRKSRRTAFTAMAVAVALGAGTAAAAAADEGFRSELQDGVAAIVNTITPGRHGNPAAPSTSRPSPQSPKSPAARRPEEASPGIHAPDPAGSARGAGPAERDPGPSPSPRDRQPHENKGSVTPQLPDPAADRNHPD